MARRGPKSERPPRNEREGARRAKRETDKQEQKLLQRTEQALAVVAGTGCGEKLRRARCHADDVDALIAAWVRDSYRIWEEPDGNERYTVKVKALSPLPKDLPLAIGDCLQSARNTLDHLAFQIANANTPGLTESQEKDSAFPIGSKIIAYTDKRVAGWPRVAVGRLNALDPGNVGLNPQHLLCRLNDLANRDKHRTISTVAMAYRMNALNFSSGYVDYFRVHGGGEVGAEPIPLYTYSRANTAQPDIDASLDVRFGPGSWGDSAPVAHTLRELIDAVEAVVVEFAEFIHGGDTSPPG